MMVTAADFILFGTDPNDWLATQTDNIAISSAASALPQTDIKK
jgi:hypothetical protein